MHTTPHFHCPFECGRNPEVWRPGLCLPLSFHQMAPHSRTHPITAYYWKDERLSWLGWLTCIGQFTHNSGHPSAAGRVQNRECLLARGRRSTTVLRNQRTCICQIMWSCLQWKVVEHTATVHWCTCMVAASGGPFTGVHHHHHHHQYF